MPEMALDSKCRPEVLKVLREASGTNDVYDCLRVKLVYQKDHIHWLLEIERNEQHEIIM